MEQESQEDLGVQLVKDCQLYMQKSGSGTCVMGASFRNTDQILKLAGIDYLTISPSLLNELSTLNSRNLDSSIHSVYYVQPIQVSSREDFYDKLKQDKMAEELLNDGIRRFSEDTINLEQQIGAFLDLNF